MKTFRYKHTALIWALLSVVLALSIGAIIWNTFSLVKDTELSTNNTLSYLFIIVSGALLSAFTISVMLGSKYVIKNGVLVLKFGFVPTKLKIDEIVQFTHFKKSDKLVAYFSDAKFTVIIIKSEQYDNFVNAVREINPQIIYDSTSKDLANN